MKSRTLAFVVALLFGCSATSPTSVVERLDGSSEDAMHSSFIRVAESLPNSQKPLFEKAFAFLLLDGSNLSVFDIRETSPRQIYLLSEAWMYVTPDNMKLLNGKTGGDVVALSKERKKQKDLESMAGHIAQSDIQFEVLEK